LGYFWTITTLVVALGLTWRYLGSYMAAVFEGRVRFLSWAERPIYRLLGTGPDSEQCWKRYAASLVIFSAVSIVLTYLILRVGGIDMLLGRFGVMIPALALGGTLAAKNIVPGSLGTFRTDNGMFVGLVVGVIFIIGGLTFFPAVSLGPIVEQLSHGKFF
jgi:K+-transporting ATPase A subunit